MARQPKQPRDGYSLPYTAPAPAEDDLRHEAMDYDPSIEPDKSLAWLNLLQESEKAFQPWNDHCDKIEERYANLARLSNMARDKQFQLFWANVEVLKPAIYAKPPVPVVVPKFKDRRPVYDAASELLERCATVAFDLGYINETMTQIRDDMALTNRGVMWCRYEGRKGSGYYDREHICYDFKNRKDFLHSLSRTWQEVWWVAAASYLTRSEARDRFAEHSGDCYQDVEYKVNRTDKQLGGADNRERGKFWEIWNKRERRVIWVAEGCEDILDEADPHLELQGFFPCPKPAYGTRQPNSLVPVPDVLQYKDQLDEIDMLTGRIHALSNALEAKGFYPAGGAEISEAVQAAVAAKTSGRLLVPISNWAAFGGSKEVIIWLPIDMISQVITALVDIRKQVIDDVYQIMGLSDIMRGATDARETLGAQELKTQYGSSRVRDKQYELARVGRDAVVISCEIITELFDPVTMIEMSQTQLPTEEMQQQQVVQLQQQMTLQKQQLTMVAQNPQAQQMAQQNPEQAGQLAQQGQGLLQTGQQSIAKILGEPNIDQVFKFLKSNRARAFTLDIETDSTIVPDENAEKESRTEFLGMLSPLLQQLAQMVTAQPKTASFAGEVLKFSVAPFRVGRSLDGAIDELVEQMKDEANQPRADDPTTAANKTALQVEQMKDQRQSMKDRADVQLKATELQMKDQHEKMKIASNEKLKIMELNSRGAADAAKARELNQKAMLEREGHQVEMLGTIADIHNTQAQAQAHRESTAEMAARRQVQAQQRPVQRPY